MNELQFVGSLEQMWGEYKTDLQRSTVARHVDGWSKERLRETFERMVRKYSIRYGRPLGVAEIEEVQRDMEQDGWFLGTYRQALPAPEINGGSGVDEDWLSEYLEEGLVARIRQKAHDMRREVRGSKGGGDAR